MTESPKYYVNPLRDASPKYFINPFKQGQDRSMSFSEGTLASTPLKKMNEMVPGYDHMLDIGMASQQHMGSLTPSNSFSLYTHSQQDVLHPSPFLMTPTRNLSSSDLAESSSSSWSCANDNVVRKAMCKCDYPGCHKAFRRNEHLKRHKQTFHGEGPNKFMCEFCGKDQFNRQDNLNNHRKLHARPNSRNRGVEFIPAAVAVIEQEERSRKRRAPPKSKTLAALHAKHDDDYE
ncbi:Regulatory protein brlA [Escovopsis weberi]|uniref:Regulatory protein brlA n=1 Tax=Escovopsis weberi TaxID=150374 RepID=A0A0M8N7P7_ESCWE|nr:Regulatory protein brlA [Escovopsis weberi]